MMKIKQLLSILLLLLIISSCNIDKRIARKQARWCNKESTSDTVKIVQNDTVYQETIKTVKIAPNPDTLQLYAIAYCDSMQNVQMPLIIVEDKENGNKASIEIIDNKVNAEIICNMDSLEQIIIEKNTLIKNLKSIKINDVKIVTKIKKAGAFYIWFFWILVVLVVVSTALYLTRWYFLSKVKATKNITDLLNG